MKYSILILLTSTVFGSTGLPTNLVSMIQKINADKKEFTVTLMENSTVFRIAKGNRHVPCLENAYKAQQKVALNVNKEAGLILDCKMAGLDLPGSTNASKVKKAMP